MTAYTQITEENAQMFKPGTKVRFEYGPMCGGEDATVTGYETTRWGTQLIATTENGERHTISGFTTIGVGAYLIASAAHEMAN